MKKKQTIETILAQAKQDVCQLHQQYIDQCVNPNTSKTTLLLLACLTNFCNTHFNQPFRLQSGNQSHSLATTIVKSILNNDHNTLYVISYEFTAMLGWTSSPKKNHLGESISLYWKNAQESYTNLLTGLYTLVARERPLIPAMLTCNLLVAEFAGMPKHNSALLQSRNLLELLKEVDRTELGSKDCINILSTCEKCLHEIDHNNQSSIINIKISLAKSLKTFRKNAESACHVNQAFNQYAKAVKSNQFAVH